MVVRDPLDEGDAVEPQDVDATYIGTPWRHLAGLLHPLGLTELAAELRRSTTATSERVQADARRRIEDVLASASANAGLDAIGPAAGTDLIGGVPQAALIDTALCPDRSGRGRGVEVSPRDGRPGATRSSGVFRRLRRRRGLHARALRSSGRRA